MDRLAILDRLKAEAPALRQKYRLQSLAVFGSMARGDDREGSDVDVLVTFEGKAGFDHFMGLKLDLEDMFLRSVDLVTPNCFRPDMLLRIGLVQTWVTLGGVKSGPAFAGNSCSAIAYGRNNAAVDREKCYPGAGR